MSRGDSPHAPAGGFPLTRHSLVLEVASPDPQARRQAFDALVASYWRPVYKYLRLRWKAAPADAEDLTQGFFTRALEKDFLAPYQPDKARFRTFLRTCLDAFVAKERRDAGRLKRGGAVQVLSLDFESVEGELRHHPIPDPVDLEAYFHREWVRSLFTLAVEDLRRECEERGKALHFTLFERYDLEAAEGERPTYQQLAGEHGLPVTQVTNYLAFARRRLRERVLERLRQSTGSESEMRAEARQILGVDPG